MSSTDRISQIEQEATEAIASASTTAALEEIRVRYLGRKAELPNLLRSVAELPPEERAATGKAANQARRALEGAIESRGGELASTELEARLVEDRIDVTLPGDPLPAVGRLHLMTQTRREIEDVFIGLGFNVAEGPEVETVYYNFDALNHARTHPSRLLTDTFYLKSREEGVDIFDPHTPLFHQIEGLAVDDDVTLADLKGTLLAFARAIFGEERQVRLRPHFFPFTEPSVEVDVSCFNCVDGITADGRRCPLCKGTAWIEILGSGMVDPNVLAGVADNGYDPEKVQGFAFGMGIERIAMLKHGIPDLRLLYDNDIRLLEQF